MLEIRREAKNVRAGAPFDGRGKNGVLYELELVDRSKDLHGTGD